MYSETPYAEVFELGKYLKDVKIKLDYFGKFNKESIKTLLINGDINLVSIDMIKDFLLTRYGIDLINETVDVVTDGASCESFSIVRTRTENDEKDNLLEFR